MVFHSNNSVHVAPFVGAGIEITWSGKLTCQRFVAPFVGAGIEIIPMPNPHGICHVAPFVGAGIEILPAEVARTTVKRRTLRGCGD